MGAPFRAPVGILNHRPRVRNGWPSKYRWCRNFVVEVLLGWDGVRLRTWSEYRVADLDFPEARRIFSAVGLTILDIQGEISIERMRFAVVRVIASVEVVIHHVWQRGGSSSGWQQCVKLATRHTGSIKLKRRS